jgi:hypothetical protein
LTIRALLLLLCVAVLGAAFAGCAGILGYDPVAVSEEPVDSGPDGDADAADGQFP